MIAVAEAVGPVAAIVANGDAANRGIHAAARRPDLIGLVFSLETIPLSAEVSADSDALVSSTGVLTALREMMRNDFRAGMMAAIQRGNPDWSPDYVRERVDMTTAYIDHEAGIARLEGWIEDQPTEDALALGDRLVIPYEGAGAWFTADLHDRVPEFLPEARLERLDGGAISRPELTAEVVQRLTAAATRQP
jgi:hypothetical protein